MKADTLTKSKIIATKLKVLSGKNSLLKVTSGIHKPEIYHAAIQSSTVDGIFKNLSVFTTKYRSHFLSQKTTGVPDLDYANERIRFIQSLERNFKGGSGNQFLEYREVLDLNLSLEQTSDIIKDLTPELFLNLNSPIIFSLLLLFGVLATAFYRSGFYGSMFEAVYDLNRIRMEIYKNEGCCLPTHLLSHEGVQTI